jgi:transcriptional regulator with XRE-family HTH domain
MFPFILLPLILGADMTIEEAFGQTIRELRKSKKLSQEALSDLSSLDRSFISQLECGNKQPSLVTIFQLAEAFNMSAANIISMVEEKINSK